jgi:hypothetical protein
VILEDDSELKTVEKSDLLGGVITVKGTAASMKRTPEDRIIKAGQREFTAIPFLRQVSVRSRISSSWNPIDVPLWDDALLLSELVSVPYLVPLSFCPTAGWP